MNETSPSSSTYQNIAPWPDEYRALASSELPTLTRLWQEQKTALVNDGRLEPFVRRLKREWAIETGLIERLYTWDRGITETLIEQGIDAALIISRTSYDRRKAENVRSLILDQENVIEGLFEFVKGDANLSEHYIRSLHQALTVHQETTEAYNALQGVTVDVPLLRGQYKNLPNNPTRTKDMTVHAYCPPELVSDEMQGLLKEFEARPNDATPEVSAAWLHHRFAQIHPFQDGNGRVARSLATLVFLKHDLFPLVLRDADRDQYIDALEQADSGNLAPLVALFASRQRDVILGALSTDRAVGKSETREAIKRLAISKLGDRQRRHREQEQNVFATGTALHGMAFTVFQGEAKELDRELRSLTPRAPGEQPYNADVKGSTPAMRGFYRSQIFETARSLGGYFANLETIHSWIRLSMQTGPIFELVVSIHGVGREFNGVLVASAFYDTKYRQEEDGPFVVTGVAPACTEPFQFNYLETEEAVKARFGAWLEEVTTIGLASWQRTLEG